MKRIYLIAKHQFESNLTDARLVIASLVLILTPSIYLSAQDLEISRDVSMELTKTSRSGRYGGTLINGEEAKVIYVSSTKDEGAQIEEYSLKLTGGSSNVEDKFVGSDEASESLPWFMPKSRVENMTNANGKWLNATRAFGSGMKLYRGTIKKNYTLGVYTGMEFVQEESIKPKAGDIWRITPGGYKSLSDYDALATSNGFYQDLQKYGNPLLMPANATLLAAGVITEKISLKTDQKYASNRVAVLTMNGMNFDDMEYDTYLLPFTAATVISGLGQDDNLCSLFAPLNGPTNLSSLKHYYWKDNKEHFTVMRFNDQRKLVDSVSFQSKLMWADYQILNGHGSTYVLGKGNTDFSGWYRGLAYRKLNGMQITKIKDGKVLFSKMFDDDVISDKLVGAGGKKVKFNLYIPRNDFDEILDLPNNETLIIGHTPLEFYALQLSPMGDLKAFYLIPLGEKDKLNIMNYQYMMKNSDLILVVNLQPVELSTAASVETSSTKVAGAGVVTTITTTTVKKLNEVFMQSMVYRLTPSQTKLSNALAFDGKKYFTMGSFPAMFTQDAVYFAGREKGPKGKIIHVVKVDY